MHFGKKLNFHPKYTQLSHILTSTPPWLYPKPAIRSDLNSTPKSHNPSFSLAELHSIFEGFLDHPHCYTHGSRINHKTACAYSVAGSTYSFRLYNSSAISIFISSENPFSTHPLVQRTFLSLHTHFTCNVSRTFIWIPALI